jgi:hypothetical protein
MARSDCICTLSVPRRSGRAFGSNMKVLRVIAFIGLGAVVGYSSGWYVSGRQYRAWDKHFEQSTLDRSFDAVAHSYHLLVPLRAGYTNAAIESLEDDMDIHLSLLGSVLERTPAEKRPDLVLGFMGRVRDYRMQFPRKSFRSEMDRQVAEAFALLSTNR